MSKVESDHGCFSFGVEILPFQDELYGFYEWLCKYGIADHIAERLHYKQYLTEGDMAELLIFKSKLEEPSNFFCGDKKAYEKDYIS